ncbi:threonine-phosphate decarboxylase CobD [Kosakonia sacchari]|uniref:threonine-phosphate decarboxylase n=1 Tax=Kosakonia sacchari TaxID=1158459 RepID=A0A1G4XJ05_9ENTR|nr:threonine-phosphate decarboxylase CobD [Kosakonia sacchari]AHJ74758.1 threonine-phosphate decarboxylase [Kosakonia sacchari SP1]NUL35957.1 threonine-phosphate decarboxylase [Kosakonia sacchari]SCX41105.1 L-threonine O-3-phosphate decarboxylase [Kosakonia sacchari]
MALFHSAHGGNTREAAELLGIAAEELLDFSANINPAGMPASLKHALQNNLSLAERYPDVEYQRLHQALAAHHQVPASWILAGNGETEAIFALVNMLKPRKAMLITPGFAEYRRALALVECGIRDYQLRESDGWQLTDALLGALTVDLDCLFLCTPNNPTGLLPDDALLHAIAARCKALGITLVLDEAFMDFIAEREGFIPYLAQNPHVWVLRSLTKFYAIPGLRLGYALSSNEQQVRSMRDAQMPWSINAFAALAGEVILQDCDYQQASWNWLNKERPRLFAALNALPGLTVWPGCANYLFMRCDVPEMELQQALLSHHILIRSCANYPGLDARYYRIAVRSEGENDRLIAAMTAVLSGTNPAR